jgi:hypothetical protein
MSLGYDDDDYADATDIVLPFQWSNNLISEEYKQLLSNVCVPFKDAKEGDILAITMTAELTKFLKVSPRPGYLIVMGPDDLPMQQKYCQMDLTPKPTLAHELLMLDALSVSPANLETVAYSMSQAGSDTVEDFAITVTPHGVILEVADYYDTVIDGTYFEEPVDQNVVDQCMVLLANKPASNHDIIQNIEGITDTAELMLMLNPIFDPDDDEGPLPIALPQFQMPD